MKNNLLCKCEQCLSIYVESLHKIIYDLQQENNQLIQQLKPPLPPKQNETENQPTLSKI